MALQQGVFLVDVIPWRKKYGFTSTVTSIQRTNYIIINSEICSKMVSWCRFSVIAEHGARLSMTCVISRIFTQGIKSWVK